MKNYKKIKKTHNRLPKFDDGKIPSTNLSELNNLQGVNISQDYYKNVPTLGAALHDPKNGQLGQIKPLLKINKPNTVENVGNLASSAVSFAGATISAFGNNKDSQQVLNESGQSSKQVMGVGYTYQNGPDEYEQMRNLSRQNTSNTLATAGTGAALGASIGSIIPGGTVVGGIIGAGVGAITGWLGGRSRRIKLQKQINNARHTAEARNSYAYAGAASTGMQNEYYQENGDTDNGILYANKGKDLPMYNTGKDSSPWVKVGKNTKVWSPTDYDGQIANAKVGLGESLVDFKNRNASFVSKGKGVGVDDQYAKVDEDTFIAGNDRSWKDGMTFAEKAQPYTLAVQDLNKGLKATQKILEKSSLAAPSMKFFNKRIDQNMNNLQAIAGEQKQQHYIQQQYNMIHAKHGRDVMKCNDGFDEYDPKYVNEFQKRLMGSMPHYNWQNPVNPVGQEYENRFPIVRKEAPKNVPQTESIPEEFNKVDPSYVNQFTKMWMNKPATNNKQSKESKQPKQPKDYLVTPWSQWTAHLPAALGGLRQIIDSGERQQILDTYRANPYSGLALNTLAKNRPDPYSQLRAINDSERQALYSLRGTQGNLRSQTGVAAILGAGANRAGVLDGVNKEWNQHRTALSNMGAQLGQQDRVAAMQAATTARQDVRDNSKAAYSRLNTGWQNVANAYEQTMADRFKINLAQKQLAQYNQYLTRDQLELLKDYINKQAA